MRTAAGQAGSTGTHPGVVHRRMGRYRGGGRRNGRTGGDLHRSSRFRYRFVIEEFAASVVIWQLKGGGARQKRALRLIGLTFFVPAPLRRIRVGQRPVQPGQGWGIGDWHRAERSGAAGDDSNRPRPAPNRHALNNAVLVAQADETWLSNALSITVLVGLGLNATLGWWWADPTVALVVAALAARSGVEAWREAGEQPRTASD